MADEKKKSVFETLSAVEVSKHVEKIRMGGSSLSYVSWAWAWNFVKSIYPDTPTPVYTKYPELLFNKDGYQATGREVPYLTTPTGTMVECTVTIEGKPYTESLYVMDNKNRAVINPNMQQINKTQKRCLVKTLALAGLGLSIYAGEDLPMADINEADKEQAKQRKEQVNQQRKQAEQRKEQVNQQRKMSALQDEYRRLMMELINRLNGDSKRAEELVKSTLGEGKHSGQDYVNAVKALLESGEQN